MLIRIYVSFLEDHKYYSNLYDPIQRYNAVTSINYLIMESKSEKISEFLECVQGDDKTQRHFICFACSHISYRPLQCVTIYFVRYSKNAVPCTVKDVFREKIVRCTAGNVARIVQQCHRLIGSCCKQNGSYA